MKTVVDCTLEIGIDGEPEVGFNLTAWKFDETDDHYLKKLGFGLFSLNIKDGIGKNNALKKLDKFRS